MRRRGISAKQLGEAIGLSDRTIHNISCGNSQSRSAREKIADFFCETIWPEVRLSRSPLLLGPHVEIESRTLRQAKKFASQFPRGFVRRRGKIVYFLRELPVYIDRVANFLLDAKPRVKQSPPKGNSPGLSRSEGSATVTFSKPTRANGCTDA